jgi:IPT/TIG domain
MGLRIGGLAPALLAILLVACDGGFIAGSPGGGNLGNPVPTIDSLSPASGEVGDREFTLTVLGSNFVGGSIVKWNGVPLVSTFNNSTHLTALVPEANLAAAGMVAVVVSNPPPSGGNSGAQIFTINTAISHGVGLPGAFGDAALVVAGAYCAAAFGVPHQHWLVLDATVPPPSKHSGTSDSIESADALFIDDVVIVPQDSSLIGAPMRVTATATIESIHPAGTSGNPGPLTVTVTTADLLFGSAFHFSARAISRASYPCVAGSGESCPPATFVGTATAHATMTLQAIGFSAANQNGDAVPVTVCSRNGTSYQ